MPTRLFFVTSRVATKFGQRQCVCLASNRRGAMTRSRIFVVVAMALAIIAMRAAGWKLARTTVAQAQQAKAVQAPGAKMPAFQWDMTWPKPLSNDKWAIGMVVGVSVDSRDHVWVVHRVSALVKNDRYTA